jgi:phosphoribosylanthranilate isomerase
MAKARKTKAAKIKVKFCGITSWTDARRAVAAGANFLGFNFYQRSPRYIRPAKVRQIVRRLPKDVSAVGVFVDETEKKMLKIARETGLAYLQLHGDESPEMVKRLECFFPVIKAVPVRRSFRASHLARFRHARALLLDGFDGKVPGGTGKTFDWDILRRVKHGRIFLAGGLRPENVAQAIRAARPFAVDVCSGIETKPGKKDAVRMKAFVRAVAGAFEGTK